MSKRRGLWQSTWPDHPNLKQRVDVVVPFQDADPTGVAWHGNYFRYFDAARIALLKSIGFTYRDMSAIGQIWPIVDTRVRYLKSVPFGETLTVSAQLVEWAFRLRIHYELFNATGDRVNEAVTVQVPVDARDESLLLGTPAAVVERIEALIASEGSLAP
ncbi:MAG: acyl-CoA thioesterase [Pseudomonadaceae bacterium]|nr:acyl-CoA thioesterase [Pseudomonadaceae bacterium]